MYIELGGGQLKHCIVHPTRSDEKLFLLFDTTHNFKNIFNNFINKGRFNIPTHANEDILGKTCSPCFSHLKHVYAIEEHKPLKIAHALKKVSLNPSGIARTSPQHAFGKFYLLLDSILNYYIKPNIFGNF